MSATSIFLVCGMTGEYEDRRRWNVRAFLVRREAEEFAAIANDWLRDHGIHAYLDSGKQRRANRSNHIDYAISSTMLKPNFDPQFSLDYTGTEYSVSSPIELHETLSRREEVMGALAVKIAAMPHCSVDDECRELARLVKERFT